MLSLLSDEQRRERLYAIIGVLGSFVALASFFLFPVGFLGMNGSFVPTNGWSLLLFFLSGFTLPSFPLAAVIGLLIALLLPGCFFITLVIGGVGLFRPVPRRWVRLFTLALWPCLILLGLSFFADFAMFQSLSAFWGMGIGCLGILVGRYAFAQRTLRLIPIRCQLS